MKMAAARLIHFMRFRFFFTVFNTSTKTHTVVTTQITPNNTWVIKIISFMFFPFSLVFFSFRNDFVVKLFDLFPYQFENLLPLSR